MYLAAFTMLLVVAAPETRPQTRLEQVAPLSKTKTLVRTPNCERAVLLIHGLRIHPIHKDKVPIAEFHSWQVAEAPLVKKLAPNADVFAFAYGQNVAADDVAELPALREAIAHLKQLGYKDIVLIGHSAGGLIARTFVEDYPEAGVTKVIQVCSPNGGSSLARWPIARSNQKEFLDSLTQTERKTFRQGRLNKMLPANVEFVCVAGTGLIWGDGVLKTSSQWTEDLRKQGVPVVALAVTHRDSLRGEVGVELLARLVREPQPRWAEHKVVEVRKELFGK